MTISTTHLSVGLLGFALVAGCGGEEPTNSDSDTSTSGTETSTSETETTTADTTETTSAMTMTSVGPTTGPDTETTSETEATTCMDDSEGCPCDGDECTTTSSCMDGSEGCPCDGDECDGELVCEGGMCVEPPPPGCGDGVIDDGEECDDGPENDDTATCKSNCTLQVCGDGAVGPNEACDDGNDDNDDGCSNTCELASCGDGQLNEGEQCDDGNESNTDGCLNTCKSASCGDTYIQAGVEECDDGNGSNTDECTAQCVAAVCGDTYVQEGVEQCDDGNQNPNDGCSSLCEYAERQVYLASSNNALGFYRYDIVGNLWSTKINPPTATRSQLTNDGTYVYLMGTNNVVYKYNPESGQWSNEMAGPGNMVNSTAGFFKWFEDGFYYLQDGSSTMYVYRNNAWSSFDIGGEGSSAGTYDRANDELYIRTFFEMGFRVLDTNNDSVLRVITDTTHVAENSRTGSYSDGSFFARTDTGPLQRFDAQNGNKVNTLALPPSFSSGSDTDFMTGYVYIVGGAGNITSFQRFDPADNSLTTLANAPDVFTFATITVLLPLN